MEIKHNFEQLLIAVDQFLNVLVGMIIEPNAKQWCDETMSAHLWRHNLDGELTWLMRIVNGLFFWQDNHCREAYESEIFRRQYPKEYRNGYGK